MVDVWWCCVRKHIFRGNFFGGIRSSSLLFLRVTAPVYYKVHRSLTGRADCFLSIHPQCFSFFYCEWICIFLTLLLESDVTDRCYKTSVCMEVIWNSMRVSLRNRTECISLCGWKIMTNDRTMWNELWPCQSQSGCLCTVMFSLRVSCKPATDCKHETGQCNSQALWIKTVNSAWVTCILKTSCCYVWIIYCSWDADEKWQEKRADDVDHLLTGSLTDIKYSKTEHHQQHVCALLLLFLSTGSPGFLPEARPK